jgi:CO dehydrogenase nickel-insertion accessory protein CooC1
MCPEIVMLKEIISEFLVRCSEMVIMDMDAGVEHLYRALRNPLTPLSSW